MADASTHLSDEFPAGYSLTRCSPAELVSASPAGIDDVSAQVQVRGFFDNDRSRTETRNHFHRQQSHFRSLFFCPKDGETLSFREELSRATPHEQLHFLIFLDSRLSGRLTLIRNYKPDFPGELTRKTDP